ncbi:MAG: 50S ribosomal protein L32 [Deltaproteobacteria bacterium]|nr:50S ribosomal protein L32 [Myxococcales bacterium]MCZ6570842.1 50S ribosomal protein L32 [Deltaproteobacteria bacterium]MCZ6714342.1 50S ribosomal protein L32 [Deltaproteobacteria bacterium]MCZ6823565.1 50S ribosomal protein L32 [Deltaproteobacteria bacterium]TDJ02059.1 MAG: 50S ribosomal protein L32 [Deltaproteobacteria bacterium]
MAVPKKKMSKSRSRMRRAHQALALPNRSPCSQCGAPRESHRVCAECGYYRGRQIFKVEKEQEA